MTRADPETYAAQAAILAKVVANAAEMIGISPPDFVQMLERFHALAVETLAEAEAETATIQ